MAAAKQDDSELRRSRQFELDFPLSSNSQKTKGGI
jgi:hypothetical protein